MKMLNQRPWLLLIIPIIVLLGIMLIFPLYPTDFFSSPENKSGSTLPTLAVCGLVCLMIPMIAYHFLRKLIHVKFLVWAHVALCLVCAGAFQYLFFEIWTTENPKSTLLVILGAAVFAGYLRLIGLIYLGVQILLLTNIFIGLRRKIMTKKIQQIPAN